MGGGVLGSIIRVSKGIGAYRVVKTDASWEPDRVSSAMMGGMFRCASTVAS